MTTSPRIYLNLSLHISSRRRADGDSLSWDDRFTDIDEYVKIAQAAQRARIDALFLADHPVLYRSTQESPKHTLDPLVLLTSILASVPDIGGVITASTSLNNPFDLARRLQTLNWLSKGRVAWNLVATWNPDVAANYGASPLADHAARYAQATEATDVISRLWQSWALPEDTSPGGVRGISLDHVGEYFSVRGPLTVPNTPWGPPIISQAGASPQGIELGGRFGEIIYAAEQTVAGSKRYKAELHDAAVRAGRIDPVIRVLPGLRILTGSTAAEVESKLARERASTSLDDKKAHGLAEQLSLDLSTLDVDAPLSRARLRAGGSLPQGMFRAITDLLDEEPLSFRQLVERRIEGHRLVSGTPDQIADDIESWWRAGAVDGFTVNPYSVEDDLDLFLTEVIPILQQRGIFPTEYTDQTLRERFDLNRTSHSIAVSRTAPPEKAPSLSLLGDPA